MATIFYSEANKQWIGMVELPKGMDGKRKRIMRKGATEKEVQKALKPYIEGEQTVTSSKATVGDLCDAWFASRSVGEDAIRTNTKANYTYIIEKLVKPFIGGQRVDKVQDYHINQYMDALKSDSRPRFDKDGKQLISRKTGEPLYEKPKKDRVRQMAWVLLNSVFRYAKKKKMIAVNPMEDAAKPKTKEKKMQCLTKPEIQAFLTVIRNEDQFPLFFLALYSGMRIGELLGLQHEDLDLQNNVLRVNHTLVEDESGHINVGEPCECCGVKDGRAPAKTDAGIREIELTPELVTTLRKQQERLLGLGLRACPWVFPSSNGTPLLQDNTRKLLKRFLKLAMIKKHIRFHDLRHSAATLMLTVGADTKMIQQRLGHSDEKMMKRYVHAVKEHESIVAGKLAGVFAGVGQ